MLNHEVKFLYKNVLHCNSSLFSDEINSFIVFIGCPGKQDHFRNIKESSVTFLILKSDSFINGKEKKRNLTSL